MRLSRPREAAKTQLCSLRFLEGAGADESSLSSNRIKDAFAFLPTHFSPRLPGGPLFSRFDAAEVVSPVVTPAEVILV